jgi:hypothetical protein
MRDAQSASPTKALQLVLRQAIDNIRPDSNLVTTAAMNRFCTIFWRCASCKDAKSVIQADRLAMSESDLYRKQRIAVDEVARQLAMMEESHPESNEKSA